MSLSRNPFSLGHVVGSISALVPIIDNHDTNPDVVNAIVSKLEVRALPTNVANVYLGYSDMNPEGLVNVLAILSPGDTWSYYDATSLNTINPADFYIAVAEDGDGVLPTFHVR